jgi:hypothetical protein
MKEREKILSGKKKKRALAARTVYVSLDRADAIIDGCLFPNDGQSGSNPKVRVADKPGT